MKKYFSLSMLLLFTLQIEAQPLAFEWAKSMLFGGAQSPEQIFVDKQGYTYITGDTPDTVYVSKMDSTGSILWKKGFDKNMNNVMSYSITVDSSENIYLLGSFSGTVDFDPSATISSLNSLGGKDAFILKLDSLGDFLWVKQIGGSLDDVAASIAIDKSNNIYLLGQFKGVADVDPGAGVLSFTSFGDADIFVSKLDSFGNLLWARQLGGAALDYPFSIAVDSLGNVYSTGMFYGTTDFDPSPGTFSMTTSGGADIFILKLDSLGNFIWAKKVGGTGYDSARSLVLDASGNVYTTGCYTATCDFDPSSSSSYNLTPAGSGSIFILKLNALGDFVWAKEMGSAGSGGTYQSSGYSLALDSIGDIYVTGFYEGTVDFDPGAGVYNLTFVYGFGFTTLPDIFILKLDALGNFSWAIGMGTSQVEVGQKIHVDNFGNIYTAGYFSYTLDFDPGPGTFNLNPVMSTEAYVLKLSQIPLGIKEHNLENLISLYPNPTSNNLTIETAKPTNISIENLLGQELFNSKIEKSQTIDVSFLSNGIYFVKDLQDGGSVKFIKQ